MPYLRALSSFRDGVRKIAIAKGETALTDILALCDRLRDDDLVPLGVALDDQEGEGDVKGLCPRLPSTLAAFLINNRCDRWEGTCEDRGPGGANPS